MTDYWQGLGLGTKLVDIVLDVAKDMGLETIFAIVLPDNYRAISLIKKMGFSIEYLSDGTVKGALDLKGEDLTQCILPMAQIKVTEKQEAPQVAETNKVRKKEPEASS